MSISAILFISSFLLGTIGALLLIRFAFKWGLLDNPNNRSSHDRPIPNGGGIGILAAFILASLILNISLALWIPAVFLSLLSLCDDRFHLSPKLRLPFQFVAAIIFVLLSAFSSQPPLSSFLFSLFFIFFIVATANWYNFMDGINGIAGITGIVGFGLLVAFNILNNGDSRFSVLSVCIALSCLGFLPFNMPKAKIFMGDVGSILLGFVFASIVVILSKNFLDFTCLASFLFPFYADEFVTMAIRINDGENLLKPHRRHFYQVLANESGIAHWKISLGYGVLQLSVGCAILSVRPFGIYAVLSMLIILFIGFICVNYVVRRRIEEKNMS